MMMDLSMMLMNGFMMTKKSNFWVIQSTDIQLNKVVFEEEVTSEDAIKLFLDGVYDDIIDVELISTESAIIAENQ